MDLFNQPLDKNRNYLPKDGTVDYYGKIFDREKADFYYNNLQHTIEWRHDEATIFGKKIITRREVAWYGDEPFEYTYSNNSKYALPWTEELLELKTLIEEESGETYNSCLLNLYHNGEEGVGWHSDGEPDLKKDGAIASMSLGAERRFVFKHKKTKEKVEITLEHGSLLVMKGATQRFWLHQLPKSKNIQKRESI